MLNKKFVSRASSPSEQLPTDIRDAEHRHEELSRPVVSQLHTQGQVDPVHEQGGLVALAMVQYFCPDSQKIEVRPEIVRVFFLF